MLRGMEILETKSHIDSWVEEAYREVDGQKWTHAKVTLSGSDGLSAGAVEFLMFYRPDGSTTYVSLMQLSGVLDGRSGSFVLQGQGTFDGTTARSSSAVVTGSGTGELTSIGGTAESVSTHADYPMMPLRLEYELA